MIPKRLKRQKMSLMKKEEIKMEVTLAVVLSLVVGFGAGYFLVKKNVL